MTPFDTFVDYLALKRHFTDPKYDYFKYNGKVKASAASFEKRPDKLFFQKLAKHADPHGMIIACLLDNEKVWIRDIAYGDSSEFEYTQWLKRQQSLFYIFKNEITPYLPDNPNDLILCKRGEHPLLIRLYMQKKISIETLSILAIESGGLSVWEKTLSLDSTISLIIAKIKKYHPFLTYDRKKFINFLVDYYDDLRDDK